MKYYELINYMLDHHNVILTNSEIYDIEVLIDKEVEKRFEREKLITQMMQDDEKDGLYESPNKETLEAIEQAKNGKLEKITDIDKFMDSIEAENKKELLMTIGLTKEDKSDFDDNEVDSFFDEFIDLVEKYNFCAGGGIKPYDEKTDLIDV